MISNHDFTPLSPEGKLTSPILAYPGGQPIRAAEIHVEPLLVTGASKRAGRDPEPWEKVLGAAVFFGAITAAFLLGRWIGRRH